jgi:transposase
MTDASCYYITAYGDTGGLFALGPVLPARVLASHGDVHLIAGGRRHPDRVMWGTWTAAHAIHRIEPPWIHRRLLIQQGDRAMPLRKYDQEIRERAGEDVPPGAPPRLRERVGRAGRRPVGELLDVKPETLRGWIDRVELDTGQCASVPSSAEARINELERENAELRRANEILKTASAFSPRRSGTTG